MSILHEKSTKSLLALSTESNSDRIDYWVAGRVFIMYDLKAIATRYRNIVFRSRTEAYAYEYLRMTNPRSTILYESRHYKAGSYTPDFIIGDDDQHIAIEVKPMMAYAEPEIYNKWLDTFSCMDDFVLWTPVGATSIQYPNKQIIVDEFLLKEAYNTVKLAISKHG